MLDLNSIKNARTRIREFVRKTPLIKSTFISKMCGGNVYLKLENLQITNSFKVRGAFNRMLEMSSEEKKRGVITASSGNHAQGVALAAKFLDISAKIVVPAHISELKLNKIRQYNVTIVQEGNFDQVERKARDLSIEEDLTYISPYNDLDIISGQGTIALEIYEELKNIDSIITPIGGGGLISGIALAAKSIDPNVQTIGVQTKGASTMYESWKSGKIVHIEESQTIAEGLSGGLEEDAKTFDLINRYVDKIALVKEENVKKAIRILWKEEGQIVEGAGATPVAYILEETQKFRNKNVIAIISGGNIENYLLTEILG
ncbi:MAG: threonine/serine dehydratase [Promethearchaeota archaeon]